MKTPVNGRRKRKDASPAGRQCAGRGESVVAPSEAYINWIYGVTPKAKVHVKRRKPTK